MAEAAGSALERRAPEGIEQSRLSNGIRVLTEHMPGVRSAAVGVWIRQGAAHERGALRGASHLLEHLVFKGTRSRTAREIALELESLGGSLDAYTGREQTTYQARILDEHLEHALGVVADVILEPRLRARDLDLEREVVLEEISTVEDTPDDLVFELHGDRLWGGHPYGQSILGTRETVSEMGADTLRELHRERYLTGDAIVVATGNVDHERVARRVEDLFGHLPPSGERAPMPDPGACRAGDERVERESAQTHVVFGTDVPPHSDPRRYAFVLVNTAFGGGMSSRLFQTVREELALAYSVYSFQSFYRRAGLAGVYVGTRPEWDARAVEAIRREYRRLAEEGLGERELAQTKQQVKGQIMLSLESTTSRLYRIASFALHDEPILSLDEILARVDGVTRDDVAEVAAEFFDPDRQLVLRLGPPRAASA